MDTTQGTINPDIQQVIITCTVIPELAAEEVASRILTHVMDELRRQDAAISSIGIEIKGWLHEW